MNRYFYFVLLTMLVSCGNQGKKEYPPITDKFILDDNRSCEAIFATKYETVDDLLTDFHETARYKDSLELNLRLGTHFHYKANYDTALFFYKKAAKIDSSEFELFYNISLIYSEKNDFNKALDYVDRALILCGNRWEVLNSKCYILGKLDRCEEAVQAGLVSKHLNPDNRKIYGNLLRCFDKMNQADSVKEYIHQVDIKFNQTTDWIDSLRMKYG